MLYSASFLPTLKNYPTTLLFIFLKQIFNKYFLHTHNLFSKFLFYYIIIICDGLLPAYYLYLSVRMTRLPDRWLYIAPKLDWIPEGRWWWGQVDANSWRRLRHLFALEFGRKETHSHPCWKQKLDNKIK